MDQITIETKEIVFAGDEITAILDKSNGKIYVPVRVICHALGMSSNDIRVQRRKIQEDEVLSKGGTILSLPSKGGNQETLCVESEFVPLWMAKLNPNIIKDECTRQKVVKYQLEAKDVLAKAFAKTHQVDVAQPPILPAKEEEAAGVASGWLRFASLLKVPTHIAQINAVKAAKEATGLDFSQLLLSAPAQDNIKTEEKMLEPADIGTALGLEGSVHMRGRTVNKMLEKADWQEHINRQWIPLGKAKELCSSHAWHSNGKSGYNLKWNLEAVRELKESTDK